MSSGGNCSCGSSCSCDGCGCSMYPNISETVNKGTRSIVTGLAPKVNMNSNGGADMIFTKEGDGCNCGSSCTCDPCNC